jgi:PAS domain S-box-containing protein
MPTADMHAWLCQQIVDGAQDAIIFADRDGIIRLWNAGAEALFGYRAAEALGQSLDLIIPERQRPRHWEGYHRVMATGVTRYGQEMLAVPGTRKDGARSSLEFRVVLVRHASGAVLGVGAVLRDVTARWQKERELRERLAALEAKVPAASNS